MTRSAEWIKLQYENQKPMQTLVGLLVKEGSTFSASDSKVTLPEGRSQTLSVQADGAQKLYWILKRDGVDSIVAVDQYSYTLDAGRVMADTSFGLQCKAVYANQIKTADIAVTVKEEIPEPVFTLDAPTKWNGRDTIEVVPRISNLAAMQSQGAGELHYAWSVSGGAVIKQVEPDRLVLKRSQYSGPVTVSVAIDNRGSSTNAATEILVTEPNSDPWVQWTPGKDEKPVDNQFYARDDKNFGTLHYNGTWAQPADSVFLRVYADEKLFVMDARTFKTENRKLATDKDYSFTVRIKPGLIKYKVEFGTKTGDDETVVRTVTNLVCGDAYIIQGQSNALATDTGEKSPPETNDWIRSYGRPEGNAKDKTANLWCNPVWKAQKGDKAELGWWGMELAKRLVESQKMPIFIINGAVGGTRIDQPVVWADTLAGQFYLDGEEDKVVSGSLNGNVLTLTLKEASAAKHITYLKEKSWSQEKLVVGKNGIAALTFHEVTIGVK